MTLFAIPFPTIDPVLVEVGPFAIRWYALAYIVGIFLGWWYAKRLVRNPSIWGPAGSPMTPADIDDFFGNAIVMVGKNHSRRPYRLRAVL